LRRLLPNAIPNSSIYSDNITIKLGIPKPVWAVGFAHEQTLRDATLAVLSFLILKRLQHIKDGLSVIDNISGGMDSYYIYFKTNASQANNAN
jgi:hypothetical protein